MYIMLEPSNQINFNWQFEHVLGKQIACFGKWGKHVI